LAFTFYEEQARDQSRPGSQAVPGPISTTLNPV